MILWDETYRPARTNIYGSRRAGKTFFPPCAPAIELIDPAAQIILLVRFLCFMAVVYLALHKIVAHYSRKPDSKLLWFFGVVTAPLTRPVRRWLAPGAPESKIISAALLFYFLLWLVIVMLAKASSSGRA